MSNEQYLKGWNKQTPAYTTQTADGRHPDQQVQEFGPGLRGAALYADLGIAEATGGQFRAHIIKWNQEQLKKDREANVKPTTGMHRHHYDFHFNYVLKGSTSFVVDGVEGVITCKAGDSYFLPSRILHNEIEASDDIVILELYGPAKVATEQLEDEVGQGRRFVDLTKTADEKQYLKGWNKQTPAYTTQTADGRHPDQQVQEFGPGLRGAALYADLGIAEATGGQFRAHIIKWNQEQLKKDREANVKPTTGMHRHHYDFHFNYVLKGSTSFVVDGVEGVITCKAGDSYFLPSRILHNEIEASDDIVILELYGPANVATEQLEDEVGQGRRYADMTITADGE